MGGALGGNTQSYNSNLDTKVVVVPTPLCFKSLMACISIQHTLPF